MFVPGILDGVLGLHEMPQEWYEEAKAVLWPNETTATYLKCFMTPNCALFLDLSKAGLSIMQATTLVNNFKQGGSILELARVLWDHMDACFPAASESFLYSATFGPSQLDRGKREMDSRQATKAERAASASAKEPEQGIPDID